MLPLELKALNNWVVVKEGSKIPMNAKTGRPASVSNSNTWSDFETAEKAVSEGSYANLGFVFNNNGFVGIDIDDGFDKDGFLTPETVEIIERCKSYTEISRSGRGVHIILAGDLPFSGRNNQKHKEIYKDGRYFILTGKTFRYNKITHNQRAIDWVISHHFPSLRANKMSMVNKSSIPQIEQKVTIKYEIKQKKIEFKYMYRKIYEGSRNIALTSIVGTLKNSGFSKTQAFKMIDKINRIVCSHPLDIGEIQNIVRSIYRYAD